MTRIFKKEELTDWYPAQIKPVRPGWYEVRGSALTSAPFRYFDGRYWYAWPRCELRSIFGRHSSHEWRGVRAEALAK